MSNPAEASAAPAKKKKRIPLLALAAVFVVALIGGGFFAYRTFASGEANAKTGKEKKKPAAEKKESEDGEHDAGEEEHGEEEHGATEEAGEKGKKKSDAVKQALPSDENVKEIVALDPFIVNLADQGEPHYLRLSVSVGVGGEEGAEEKPSPLFVTRVRNAMLAVLTTKSSEQILTVEGKTALRKELLRAAQAASEEPHVEAIYITDLIVQL